MKKIVKRILCTFSAALFLFALTSNTALAYSEIPDYFDFGETVFKMDAGTYKDVWVRAYTDYTYYLGDHTSKGTYMECTFKKGSEYVRLHIGPDETTKNVFFHFYSTDEDGTTYDHHDCIEVYVQNPDPAAAALKAQQEAQINALKTFSGNTADFNAYNYYTNYKDLQEAFGADPAKLLEHYNAFGINEKRVANKLIK